MAGTNVVNLGRSDTPWTPATSGGPKGTALQAAAVANGNGVQMVVDGLRTEYLEVVETAGGSGTITVEGSLDGTNWYTVGVQLVSATVAPARAITIAVTANLKSYWQVLDLYPLLRARISGIAGGAVVNVNLYALPV